MYFYVVNGKMNEWVNEWVEYNEMNEMVAIIGSVTPKTIVSWILTLTSALFGFCFLLIFQS